MFRNACATVVAVSTAAAAIFGTVAANAATRTDTFTVTATIIDSCTISANNLSFNDYDALLGTDVDATTTIDVRCSSGTTYDVRLNAGLNGTIAARQMVNGGNSLNYGLFLDFGRANNWGETDGTDTHQDTGNGADQSVTVFGRIPTGQSTLPTGVYSDTVTATVRY